ncbi:DUF1934 domain-containing protein [Lacticaseibacillus saniviri]|uniref:DUF1934 domain-containing protein n=1 Tax=Lacticaseibacillus saniviri JCM 17471 = DSM 24301 TaxID=1293598 RepID=A0A0R2MYL4_9LACO|nr:DUF1934 domain-containing protein [Lacticaseibacillus saniviri]KRO17280.1 hypothetical protein IV56_GL000400 [Lacticaseibacillus saniviri JCM 17471 = DSM 24301]MCG4282425.1 DUF1934 domain-containing protein [Lacticaseibacillus saniviri]
MDLSSGIPIQIHLETYVTQEGETEQHLFDEPGTLVQMGDNLYIRYQETDEESGTTYPVTLKVQGDGDIQLSRGASDSDTQLKLHFVNERRIITRYRTPYGVIPVETATPRIDMEFTDDPVSGEIYVEYQLFANEQHLGDYRMRLLFNA